MIQILSAHSLVLNCIAKGWYDAPPLMDHCHIRLQHRPASCLFCFCFTVVKIFEILIALHALFAFYFHEIILSERSGNRDWKPEIRKKIIQVSKSFNAITCTSRPSVIDNNIAVPLYRVNNWIHCRIAVSQPSDKHPYMRINLTWWTELHHYIHSRSLKFFFQLKLKNKVSK